METLNNGATMEVQRGKINNNFTEASIKDEAFKVNVDSAMTGDTIQPDGDNGNFFDVYLDRPITRINMPTNLRNGETYRWQIRQDMTGGRAIKWGSEATNTGLNVTLTAGATTSVLTIHSGTFVYTDVSVASGRKSFIHLDGFTNNNNNLHGLKVTAVDSSAGTITFTNPNWDLTTEATVAGVSIGVENNFYFFDESNSKWISQMPFGVTVFSGWSSSGGASLGMNKNGVYSNTQHQRAKVRFEEQLTDDFVSGSDNGLLEWREANSNGSVGTSSSDVDGNHPGALLLGLDASISADCRCSTSLGTDMFNLSNMRVGISGIIKGNANSFSTADVKWYFGWSDTNQPQSTVDGMYFELVSDGTGKARVWCVGEIGGSKTAYDTNIDLVEDDWYVLHIGKPANGDIHFTIDDIDVYEMAQSAIGLTAKVTPIFGGYYDYTGTPLPNNKQLFVDAFSLKYRMNADRI